MTPQGLLTLRRPRRTQLRQAGVIHSDSTCNSVEAVGSTVPGGIETGREFKTGASTAAPGRRGA